MLRVLINTYLLSVLIFLGWCFCPSLSAQNQDLSFIKVNILQPAEERIDPIVHSIFILPASSALSTSFTGIDSDGKVIQSITESSNLAIKTIRSFSKILQNSPIFSLNADSSGIQSGPGYFLTWLDIDSLCAIKKTEAVLCLEKTSIFCKAAINKQTQIFQYSDNTGSFSEDYYYVDQYSCEYRTSATTEWRLYIPKIREVKGWKIQIADTCNSLLSGSTHRSAFSERDLSMLTQRITFLSGKRFAYYISPTWIPVERAFFADGNRDLKRAAKHIRKGNVREAALLWKKVARTSHGKISQYARFNLILVSEIRGQAEEAYRAALDLWKISNLPEAFIYSEVLKACIDNEQMVRAQLKPD